MQPADQIAEQQALTESDLAKGDGNRHKFKKG